jgi:hypothetical protein
VAGCGKKPWMGCAVPLRLSALTHAASRTAQVGFGSQGASDVPGSEEIIRWLLRTKSSWEIDERVEHALMVERVLTRLGWLVLMLGVIGLGAIASQWLLGDLTAEKALAAAGGTTLATILSGAAAYGSGTNIGLSAARLAAQFAPAPPVGTSRHQPAPKITDEKRASIRGTDAIHLPSPSTFHHPTQSA